MTNNKEVGGRDIEATAYRLLEENTFKTSDLAENGMTVLIDGTTIIEQICQSMKNPQSQG